MTRTLTSSILIPAPHSAVLAVLHDPPALIALNPLVTNTTPAGPLRFVITDRLTLLGCIPSSTKYTVQFTLTDDGVDSEVHAAAGVVLRNQWRARRVEGEEGVTEVREDVTIDANWLLMPFTYRTLRDSHEQLLQAFKARVVGQ